jgi:GMP synthase PP-ATPase subunit
MDRINTNPDISTPPDLTDEEVDSLLSMVHETLEPEFGVIAHLPRNVGVVGDAGIWGEAVLITAHDQNALHALHNDPDRLEELSTRLTNRFRPLSSVLIDIVAQSPDSTLKTPSIDFVPDPPPPTGA